MKKNKGTSEVLRRTIYLMLILMLFWGIGVLASNNVDTLKTITIQFADKHEINIVTTKEKVSEILAENNIELAEGEAVLPTIDSQIDNLNTIKIYKISETNQIVQLAKTGEQVELDEIIESYGTVTEVIEEIEEIIPYETITKDISNGASGSTERVLQAGENGVRKVTYKVKYQNSIEIDRVELSSEIIKEPKNEIVQVQVISSRSGLGRTSGNADGAKLAAAVAGQTPEIKTMNASAYCACLKCCGKTNGITSSGAKAMAWYTLAAGKSYPVGTIMYIPALKNKPNGGWFVVQDRGGAISDSKIDIYLNTHTDAINFGRKNLECYIYM
ncbi:MAG: G5 domain-containing protein [Lachnospiraceae bacterium]|jgi:3D (Asp-Asp-Asp) domain-containing protein/uncharacterized protein YabE (DUF348 family)|nr:G5 domain-containing protein [Lachnospiraceae bacterium]